jgi:hypothetical protein
MQRLELSGLQRRLDEDGMALPNGRAADVRDIGWIRFLDVLRDNSWRTTWPSAGPNGWPSSMDDLNAHEFESGDVSVSEGVCIRLYPSRGTDSVWFDFDLRQLTHQKDADALSQFVRALAQAVQRPVQLTYEGDDDRVFALYDVHSDEFEWCD